MKFIRILISVLAIGLLSCRNSEYQKTTSAENLIISDSLRADEKVLEFIKPYKEHLNSTLDSSLAFNPVLLSKSDGDLNTPIGNLMADIVFEQANPVFKKRTGNEIDMVMLNHGGIRAIIPRGAVSTRTVYQVMPFENEIVVIELSRKKMKQMLNYLEKAKTAHPVAGIKIVANRDYSIREATINGKGIEENRTYYVATSDYLSQGGDGMSFFDNPINTFYTDYKVRNAIIDYFTKVDTIKTAIDDRYIRQ